MTNFKQVMRPQSHSANSTRDAQNSPMSNANSTLLADYLLRGWRILEVSADYLSVLIIHNKTSEKKSIPFEGEQSGRQFHKSGHAYVKKNLSSTSGGTITNGHSESFANKITNMAQQTSQTVHRGQSRLSGDHRVAIERPGNNMSGNSADTYSCQGVYCTTEEGQLPNENNSTAATQGETEYLKNYFQPSASSPMIRSNMSSNYSMQAKAGSRGAHRFSQTPHSLIVETGDNRTLYSSIGTRDQHHGSYTSHAANRSSQDRYTQPSNTHMTYDYNGIHVPGYHNGHYRSHSNGNLEPMKNDPKQVVQKKASKDEDLRRISSPGLLVPNPVVRPNNRHSLDVPGPESVKEGPMVSEAVARSQEQAVQRREAERAEANDDDGKGSVAVRYNEASIVAPDYDEDNDLDVATGDSRGGGGRRKVQDSDSGESNDIPDNSAIESSVDDEPDNANLAGAGESVTSVNSIVEAQASGSSTLSIRQKTLTTHRAEHSLIRRMQRATTELERDGGDFVNAANVVKSCAEALYAIRKVIDQ